MQSLMEKEKETKASIYSWGARGHYASPHHHHLHTKRRLTTIMLDLWEVRQLPQWEGDREQRPVWETI